MEVAPHELFTLLSPLTLFTLFRQLWGKGAIMPLFMIWLYTFMSFSVKNGMDGWME